MKKNKILAISMVAVASVMALAACPKKKKDPVDPFIPDVPPLTGGLKESLELDYSNCTVYTASLYKEDPEDLEVSEYDTCVYYYNDYAIVYSELMHEMEYPNPYMYYHDYQGENYLWFDGSEAQGEHDAWLKDNGSGISYALRNSEFYFPDFLTGINPDKAEYIMGAYYITDPVEVNRLNYSVFAGIWNNDIQEVVILVDEEGYIYKIYGYEEEDNDDEYVVIAINDIGTTIFDDKKLPAAPNAANVMEYWQYKGWAGPEKRIYPTGANIQAHEEADRVDPKEMEIGESFRVDYSVTWPSETGSYHYVKRDAVNWVSTNPKVAQVVSEQHEEQRVDSLGRPEYMDEDSNWYALDTNGKYYSLGSTKDEDIADVSGKTLTPIMEKVYHKAIKAVGAGTATIKLVCNSEQDEKEYNSSPIHGATSNGINVVVNDVKPIDTSKAVYQFKFVGISDENEVFAANTLEDFVEYPFEITSNNATIGEAKNSELFNGTDKKLYLAPATNMSGEASVKFNFGTQQVSSLAFYYGYWMSNDKNGTKPNKIEVRTSNDGETWTTIDIKDEILRWINGTDKKLLEVEFDPASYVEVYTYCNMIGGTYSWKMVMDSMTFSAGEGCNMYVKPGSEISVDSVALTGDDSIRVNETATYTAVVKPTNATNKTVKFASSDPTVATIDENTGVLIAKKVGTTVITATAVDGNIVSNAITLTVNPELTMDEKYSGTYKDNFYAPTYTAVIDASAKTLVFTKDAYTGTLSLSDWDGSRTYTFTNTDGDKIVLTFENNGASFYVSTSGSSKLNGVALAGVIELEKVINVTGIKLNVSGLSANTDGKYEILAGSEVVVTASFLPTNANNGKDVTWSVSNANGSYNTDNSRFTAVSAGDVTLTATSTLDGSIKGSVTFTVIAQVLSTSISIDQGESLDVTVGTTETLTYTLNPTGVNTSNVEFSSDDTTIAKVGKTTGIVTGVAVGEAVITVEDKVSGVKDTITINVKEASGTCALPSVFVGYFESLDSSCAVDISASGEMTLTGYYDGDEYELTFTGEFGAVRNGDKPSYRFANADSTLVVDVTLYNDSMEIYSVINDVQFSGFYYAGTNYISF